jgi:hypothetical protein
MREIGLLFSGQEDHYLARTTNEMIGVRVSDDNEMAHF